MKESPPVRPPAVPIDHPANQIDANHKNPSVYVWIATGAAGLVGSYALVTWRAVIGAWLAHSESVTAMATVAIAVYTVVLAKASIGTLRHLEREFVANHRPRLRIRHVAFRPDDNDPSVDFMIVNVGESGATLIESSVRIWTYLRGERWPAVPPYDPATTKPRTGFIANGEAVPWGELDPPGRQDLIISQVSEQHDTMLLGYLIYTDSERIRRCIGFCRKRVHGTDRFVPSDDPDYEYED